MLGALNFQETVLSKIKLIIACVFRLADREYECECSRQRIVQSGNHAAGHGIGQKRPGQ